MIWLYGEKAKICYMDTDSFIAYIKTYKDIARDVETRFDIWIKQTIIKEKSINVVGLMIDELGGNIMK